MFRYNAAHVHYHPCDGHQAIFSTKLYKRPGNEAIIICIELQSCMLIVQHNNYNYHNNVATEFHRCLYQYLHPVVKVTSV